MTYNIDCLLKRQNSQTYGIDCLLRTCITVSTIDDLMENERKIARTSDRIFYVVYEKEYNGKICIFIKKSTDNGLTWTGEEKVYEAEPYFSNPNLSSPVIAIDSDDNIHIVWVGYTGQYSGYKICYKKKTTSGWGSLEEIGGGFKPSICLDSNNNIHVVWEKSENYKYQIRYRKKTNSGWQNEVILDDASNGDCYNAAICVDSNDYVHVVWRRTSGGTSDIVYKQYTDDWQQAEIIHTYSGNVGKPSIAIDDQDNIFVVWSSGDPSKIYFRKKCDGEWQNEQVIGSLENHSYFPSIALDKRNNIYVAWQYYDGTYYQIKLRKYDGNDWSDIQDLTSGNFHHKYPNLIWAKFPDWDLGGSILTQGWALVYQRENSENTAIFLAEFKDKIDYDIDLFLKKLNLPIAYGTDILLKDTLSLSITIDLNISKRRGITYLFDTLIKIFNLTSQYEISAIFKRHQLQRHYVDGLGFYSSQSMKFPLTTDENHFIKLPFLFPIEIYHLNEILDAKYRDLFLSSSIANWGFNPIQYINLGLADFNSIFMPNEILDAKYRSLFLSSSIAKWGFNLAQYMNLGLATLDSVSILNEIFGAKYKGLFLKNLLASDPINCDLFLSLDIIDYLNFWYFYQNELSEEIPSEEKMCTKFLKYDDWDITLDGLSIKDKVTEINVYRRESEIFNHIELTIVDPKLFKQCDPYYNNGLERIELRINDKTMKFLLESREGSEESREFSIWGRCKAAILSEPFSIKTSYVIENKKASEIAKELAGSIDVDWQIYDFYVKEFTYEGYPIDGISRLAEVIGGVVRTKSDGSLLVRYKFPVRPKDLQDADAVYELDRYSNLVSLDYSEEAALYDSVEVRGADYSETQTYFSIETDKTCFEIGKEDAILKVYKYPFDIDYTVFSTDGTITKISSNKTEEITENINIENESGSTSKYIYNLTSHQWIGSVKKKNEKEDLGNIEFDGNNIQCTNCAGGYLRVNYETKYDEWRLSCSKETEVKSIVIVPEGETIVLNVIIGDGNRPAPPIQDELITEEYMAVLRGQAFLDDNYYQKIKHSVKLPYVDIEDGQVVSLADDYYNLYGNYLVKQSDISITLEEDTLKIWLSLNIEKYRKVL